MWAQQCAIRHRESCVILVNRYPSWLQCLMETVDVWIKPAIMSLWSYITSDNLNDCVMGSIYVFSWNINSPISKYVAPIHIFITIAGWHMQQLHAHTDSIHFSILSNCLKIDVPRHIHRPLYTRRHFPVCESDQINLWVFNSIQSLVWLVLLSIKSIAYLLIKDEMHLISMYYWYSWLCLDT